MGQYRKGIVALVGALVTIGSVRYAAEPWFTYAVTILTALGVYGTPNALPKEL